jgi:geranylgeranyl pyrophosphate synthase
MFAAEVMPLINIYLETLDKTKICDIIRYATSGGKCLRGFIVKHIIETIGNCNEEDIWGPVTAVELIHSSSLIVDDLPCMDNDNMRRGKVSLFKKFGRHEAILSSLYIITESIRIIFDALNKNHTENIPILITEWSNLLSKNLVVGQVMDLKGDVNEWFNIHTKNRSDDLVKYKTGALFSFSFLLGALFSSNRNFDDFRAMGEHLGFMFQIMDDYKDKDTDEQSANYILSCGLNTSVQKYIVARTNLIALLKKHKLYTPQFIQVISSIDSKFTPLQKAIQQYTFQHC